MKRNEYHTKNLAKDLSISLEHKEYIDNIIRSMIDTLIVTDEKGKIQTANESAVNLLGYKRDELIGMSFESILEDKKSIKKLMSQHSDSLMNYDTMLRTREGAIISVSISLSRLIEYAKMDEDEQEKKNKFSSIVCIVKDITERKKAEEKIKYLAYYDGLTGLPNRDLFKDRTEQAIKLADRYKRNIAMLYLDLDNFKNVNDTMGHEIGDQLLQQVAIRLETCLRKSDTAAPVHSEIENVDIVSRQGGDEFIMLLTEISKPEDSAKVAQRILEQFSRPFTLDGRDVHITVSIGIAIRSLTSNTPFYELFKNADTAMYHAKGKGKNNYKFFSKTIGDTVTKRLTMEYKLRSALSNKEFSLNYQPQFDIKTRDITGMEVLLRWQNSYIGIVSPIDFIPLAEEIGIINPIGEWVVLNACTQHALWRQKDHKSFKISINFSYKQFYDKNIIKTIAHILENTCMDPQNLVIEITESCLMVETEIIISLINEFKAMGIKVAMDDFGKGYSSLSYLKKFKFDFIKIDHDFIKEVPGHAEDSAIVKAIIKIAHSLNSRVIAEGVETEQQLKFLYENDCDLIQGYLLSKPLPADEAQKFLNGEGARKFNELLNRY